jgi:hypothetical protein
LTAAIVGPYHSRLLVIGLISVIGHVILVLAVVGGLDVIHNLAIELVSILKTSYFMSIHFIRSTVPSIK